MTTFVSRAQWGARPRGSGDTSMVAHPIITYHYVGGGWEYPWSHSTCDDKVRAIQADHMDNREWSDIAYNYLVCPHDYVYEGRGLRRSSANGSVTANMASYAICALWGTESADDALTNGMKNAFLWATDYLVDHGANRTIRGHRDWKSTDCPGDQIYAWIKAGCPDPDGGDPTNPPSDGDEEDMFTDTDRARLNWIYGADIDGDGSLSTNTLLGRVLAKLDEIDEKIEVTARKYALWEVLYELETEDDRSAAEAAFNKAIVEGKTVDEAKAASADVLASLRESIKASQASS